ncbi:hypothetical protein BDW74DRAFT_176561 [Aspergillus multicolor]|uniref:uncharacterized protein n=1 Tax=Aspergillus multicolor TaxID=41759 RepID=UPI003CCDEBC2
MKIVLWTAVFLGFAAATPIPQDPAPDPTATAATASPAPIASPASVDLTAAKPAATMVSIVTSETQTPEPKPSINYLCSVPDGAIPTGTIGDLIQLGKLQECAGSTISEKPLTTGIAEILSGLAGLFSGAREAESD